MLSQLRTSFQRVACQQARILPTVFTRWMTVEGIKSFSEKERGAEKGEKVSKFEQRIKFSSYFAHTMKSNKKTFM
jgi:hypothetical protein